MIEFTPDGPFAEKADPLFPDRVRIIGLGQTGASVCDQLVMHGRPGQDIWIFDSDQQVIEGSVVPNRQLIGQQMVHGLGCSGDIDLAREVVLQEAQRLAEVVHGCDFLILIVGLAGATGVALAEHLTQLGRRAGAKIIAMGVQPFAFEGWARRERSIEAIATLRAEADSVLVLASDRLADNPIAPKNVRHSLHLLHQMLAKGAQALSQVVCKRGLIQLSFADVRSLYGRYEGAEALENCWIAHVEGDVHDGTEDLIQRLFDCPLISDESVWKLVDHAIVAVGGTRDLGLSDVQELVGAFKEKLKMDIPIATSASLDDEHHDRVRMTVLLAMTTPIHAAVAEKPAPAPRLLGDTVPLAAAIAASAKKANAAVAAKTPSPKPAVVENPVSKPIVVEKSVPLPAAKTAGGMVAKPKLVPLPEISVPSPDIIKAASPQQARLEVQETPVSETEGEIVAAMEDTAKPPRPHRSEVRQEEMQFDGPTRGRFEKTHETIYRGENLDQPTFRRRRLVIRL